MNKKVIHQFKIKQKKANKIKEYLPKNSSQNNSSLDKNRTYYNSYLDEKNLYYEIITIFFAVHCWIVTSFQSNTIMIFEPIKINIILKNLYVISFLIPIIRLTKLYLDFRISKENLFKNFLKDKFFYYVILELTSFIIFREFVIRNIYSTVISFYKNGFLIYSIGFSGMFIYSGIEYFKAMSVNKEKNLISLIIKIIIFSVSTSILFATLISVSEVLTCTNDIEMCLQHKESYPLLFTIAIQSIYLTILLFKPYYKIIENSTMSIKENFINLIVDILSTILLTMLLITNKLHLVLILIFIRSFRLYKLRYLNIIDYLYDVLRLVILLIFIFPVNQYKFNLSEEYKEVIFILVIDFLIWIIFKLKNRKIKINHNFSFVKLAAILNIILIKYFSENVKQNMFSLKNSWSYIIKFWESNYNSKSWPILLVFCIILLFTKKPTNDEVADIYSDLFKQFFSIYLVYVFFTLSPNISESINFGNENFPNLLLNFMGYTSILLLCNLLASIDCSNFHLKESKTSLRMQKK